MWPRSGPAVTGIERPQETIGAKVETTAGCAVWISGLPDAEPAVVLESGLGASSIGWSRVRTDAASLCRVISYDRAGLGASAVSGRSRSLAGLVDDLAELIERNGGRAPVVVVGHSLGATMARQLAMARPDLVAGLVLIDPLPERWLLRYGRWALPVGLVGYRALEACARLRLIDAVTALPLFRGITKSSTSPQAGFTEAERAALAEEMRQPRSHRTAWAEFSGLLRDSRAELRALRGSTGGRVPLTVISGGTTNWLVAPFRRAMTAWHARLVRDCPGARHVVVGAGDHFIPRYQPDVVVAAIADVLHRARS